MRCRNDLYDVTSSNCVCASCLHECLSALIDAEGHVCAAIFADHLQQESHPPPPLHFPRSVSPYTIRYDLHDSSTEHPWMIPESRYFSTPQFKISTARKEHNNNTSSSKSSIIIKLFKSNKILKEDQLTAPVSSVSSPRWFPSFRKSKINKSKPDQTRIPSRYTGTCSNQTSHDSPSRHRWKKMIIDSASTRRSKLSTNVSGMIFGLSPLLRPSPIHLSSYQSYASEKFFGSFTGDFRVLAKATISASPEILGGFRHIDEITVDLSSSL